MQGQTHILTALNGILKNELTAINQYFLHARLFRHWGFEELNEAEYKQSIRGMKEADALIERILFLEGLPNLQALGTLSIGEDVPESLSADLAFEQNTHRIALTDAIALAEEARDYVTRDLLEDLLASSENAIDWYETQLSLIESLGVANYLQSQIHD